MNILNKKTTYPDTISWLWGDFVRDIIDGNYDVVHVYDRQTGKFLGSRAVGEIARDYKETFTKGYSKKRIIVSKFIKHAKEKTGGKKKNNI